MKRRVVVGFSGGVTSAWCAGWALRTFPREEVVLLFHDTKEEHPDTYRFLYEMAGALGMHITERSDGRSVTQLFRDNGFLGNNQNTPCSRTLKAEPGARYVKELKAQGFEVVKVIGYSANEPKRVARMVGHAYNEGITVRFPMIEERMTKQGCTDWVMAQGVKPSAMYCWADHANCFAGETTFITDRGVRTLASMVGKRVRVRGTRGWCDATVRSFGVQPLYRLVLARGEKERSIYVTAGHRWFVKGSHRRVGQKESQAAPRSVRTTMELRSGDRLPSVFGCVTPHVRPSAFGIAQGIVYGDGSRSSQWNAAARIVLCGKKNRELLRFFPQSPHKTVPAGIEVVDLPRHWKEPPRLDECQSFLYGWLAGYFAADGCATTDGSYILASASRRSLEVARDVAVRLGIGVNDIGVTHRRGFPGRAKSPLYSLPLIGATLRADFFLLKAHRKRFERTDPRPPHPWFVKRIEKTRRVEEVFCAVVPKGRAFTLEGNILTGNCIGCVKGGRAYWLAVHENHPDVFEQRAKLEEEFGHEIIRGGDREHVTLRELLVLGLKRPVGRREQIEIGACDCGD